MQNILAIEWLNLILLSIIVYAIHVVNKNKTKVTIITKAQQSIQY